MSKRPWAGNVSAGNPNNYECPECTFTTLHRQSFKDHCLRHLNVTYPCSQCNYKSAYKSLLKKHSYVHELEGPRFICGICNVHFASQHALHVHDGKHHRQLFSCDYCDFKSKWRSPLAVHIRTHTGDYIHVCDECGRKFASPHGLKSHKLNRHSETKLYNCVKCSFSTNNGRSMMEHETTHTGRKLFSCPDCSYKTNRKGRLTEHSASHKTSDPPYKCGICDYSSFFSINLREHQKNSHLNKKKPLKNIIKCSVCFTIFKDQVLLDKHVNKKHGEDSPSMKEVLAPFMKKHVWGKIQCSFCQAKFTDDQSFEDHVNSHTVAKR